MCNHGVDYSKIKKKKKGTYVYLTPLGVLIAQGELLLREQEERNEFSK